MKTHTDMLNSYLQRIFLPQGCFLATYLGMFLIVACLSFFTGTWAWAILLLVPLAGAAGMADQKTLEVVPMANTEITKYYTYVEMAVIGFLSLLIGIGGSAALFCLGLIFLAKLIGPILFAIVAYKDFREHCVPVLVENFNKTADCDEEIQQKAERLQTERSQKNRQIQGVQDARLKVVMFFNKHRQNLSKISEEWIYTMTEATIPDGATVIEAYQGATRVIDMLQEQMRDAEEVDDKKRVRLEEINQALNELHLQKTQFFNSRLFADDPSAKDAENKLIQKRVDALLAEKRKLTTTTNVTF